jgi:hypothetical protein
MTFRTIELTCGVARTFSSRFGRAGLPLASIAGAFFLIAVAISHSAFGASINYGDFSGDNVQFLDVTESSDDPLPLYGAPTVSGNSLSFSPQQFFAKSQFGSPINDTTDGQLTFMVQADVGQAVTDIKFTEGGALSVSGLSTATNDTYVDVSAPGFVTVTAVDGVGINPVAIPVDFKFNFGVGGNGTWRKVSEGTVNGFLWTGGQMLDITQELINRGIPVKVGASKVNINLDNILFAQSETVGSARIDKKLFLEISTTEPDPGGGPFIPEPASLTLLLFGAVVSNLGLRTRRGR